ncbi:patatin-like phospholipase family protein [Streptomyces fractus]|uniref:patatin-like phospholipase family protein n=1 Tax=Streptomyces fractus TaxID=641806 RepID=UPI003CECA6F3
MSEQESTAVVLGGGGLAGIGWAIGALAALEESGALRLAAVDHVIGTSAGSAVAAAVLQSGSAGAQFDMMVRKSRRNDEPAPAADFAVVMPELTAIHESPADVAEKTRRFVALSRERSGVAPDIRRAAVARRVEKDAWPDTHLTVTALRSDGTRALFTSASGVGLVDAITASCAVPGLWPVVRIDGEDYIDGGTLSPTNAELARDADRVIVLQPMPEWPGDQDPARRRVLDRAVVIEPSERTRAALGTDPFDPDIRGVAAVLGYEDGLGAVAAVR